MALGGGTYTSQNKVLPGSYINFISRAAVSATVGDRGVAAIGLPFDWGEGGKILDLTRADLIANSETLFGVDYGSAKLLPLREIFLHANRVLVWRLDGNGDRAENTYAEAKYAGTAGNSLKIVITLNPDSVEADPQNGTEGDTIYDVFTYYGDVRKDKQTVRAASELVANDYVTFKTTATLDVVAAGSALTGGTNSDVNAGAHQAFLTALEAYTPNAVCCASTDSAVKALYKEWAIGMRNEYGIKTQIVAYAFAADSEAVVNVKNSVDAVYWATGMIAGTAVGASAANRKYDGELTTITADYSQTQLANALKAGEFVLHRVGDDLRVLDDINSLVTVTAEKGEVFKDNKTIRVIDQIATDTAAIFAQKYLGTVPNTETGRMSLRADVLAILGDLRDLSAIDDFDNDEITVEAGEQRNSVVIGVAVTVAGTMTKLYMSCVIA
ncbi:MAG: phage tail sheath subtilisin-like domain-containing protein [Clostridia bacterium]|nr:phage tail sheath subtilisin-like domain-containing protein [Clostridia bacterium]